MPELYAIPLADVEAELASPGKAFQNISGVHQRGGQGTQGLIETLGSMVIFDENQAVSDINKYEFINTIYVQIVNFLVI